ncbi:DoxX family protein [Aldersonia sp. NBC_00410]|uniref:DoxX family protein n=1 Tax=Aldersonia sp. NBC_00410 TaxID=2975954 RepID=UPI00224D011E|nr:DoxX family protein [Aldersonia sp. NBC_00410]MCX5042382.1 DoxX family protein [Aldersonia sp. NBC_00410]
MHNTIIVISLLLAVFLGFLGIGKLVGLRSSRAITDHLGVSVPLARLIGLAECAAALGLVGITFGFTGLGIAAILGTCAMMIGAVVYHARAGDKALDFAPALVVLVASSALLALQLGTN